MEMEMLACLGLSYMLGSIPTAYILTRLFLKKDIRTLGSGNVGTTNAFRTGHPLVGAVTFLCDIGKGFGAVGVTLWLFQSPDFQPLMALMSLLLVVIGHIFPIWLKFRGGKGVAPFAGGCLCLFPYVTLCVLGLWCFIFALSRISSLSSLASITLSPLILWIFEPPLLVTQPFLLAKFGIFLGCCGLIVLKHRDNIQRLINKKESSVNFSSSRNKTTR